MNPQVLWEPNSSATDFPEDITSLEVLPASGSQPHAGKRSRPHIPDLFNSLNTALKHAAFPQTRNWDLEASVCVLHISESLCISLLPKKQSDTAGMRKGKQFLILHLDSQSNIT